MLPIRQLCHTPVKYQPCLSIDDKFKTVNYGEERILMTNRQGKTKMIRNSEGVAVGQVKLYITLEEVPERSLLDGYIVESCKPCYARPFSSKISHYEVWAGEG